MSDWIGRHAASRNESEIFELETKMLLLDKELQVVKKYLKSILCKEKILEMGMEISELYNEDFFPDNTEY